MANDQLTHLVIYRAINRIRNDAKGAFIPGAQAFEKLRHLEGDRCAVVPLASRKEESRELFKEACYIKIMHRASKYQAFESINFFCHGYPNSLEYWPKGIEGARLLARLAAEKDCHMINLWACSTADYDKAKEPFAHLVAEECIRMKHPVQIMAHGRAGHATWNPKKIFYWVNVDHHSNNVWTDRFRVCDPSEMGWNTYRQYKAHLKRSQVYRLNLPFMVYHA